MWVTIEQEARASYPLPNYYAKYEFIYLSSQFWVDKLNVVCFCVCVSHPELNYKNIEMADECFESVIVCYTMLIRTDIGIYSEYSQL